MLSSYNNKILLIKKCGTIIFFKLKNFPILILSILEMKKISLIILMSLLFGCTHRITDFTIISSKNINISNGENLKRSNTRVVGKDIKHTIVFIPTGISNMKQAIDNAIESKPGAVALVDGVVTYNHWIIPFFYGRQWYEVEGTPLIDTTLMNNN